MGLVQSKHVLLLITTVAVAVVEGFAPVAQPRLASSTELGAFFFQKPTEKSPTTSPDKIETEKSNPFAKFGKKTDTAVAEKPPPVQKKFSFGSFGKKNDADTAVEVKAPIKKILVKKSVEKKSPTDKAGATKTVAKKAVAKKAVAKKAPIKKAVVAKKAANPLAFKTPVKVKKVVVKKVLPAKNVVPKKPTKKIVKKPVKKFKNDFNVKSPKTKQKKVTIFERACHIN